MPIFKKSVCPWCQANFTPHPRLCKRQKCCGLLACQKQQKNHSHRQWKSKNKQIYRQGLKDWRQAHPLYWQNYRATHLNYTDKNRSQSRIRKSLHYRKTGLQKRIDIVQEPEKPWQLWNVERFAKYPRSLIPLVYAKSFDEKINTQPRLLC